MKPAPAAAEASALAAAGKTEAKDGEKREVVQISRPNFQVLEVHIVGTAPLLQLRFSQKMKELMLGAQTDPTSRNKKVRKAKDVQALFRDAQHISEDGWPGIPCSAFRNAMISACRLVGVKMTIAKMAVFVEEDGREKSDERTPLVKLINNSKARVHSAACRNANGGTDIRIRAVFDKWEAKVKIKFDGDMFKAADVINLMHRVGQQVGIGEGRPDSRQSAGTGNGLFVLKLSK